MGPGWRTRCTLQAARALAGVPGVEGDPRFKVVAVAGRFTVWDGQARPTTSLGAQPGCCWCCCCCCGRRWRVGGRLIALPRACTAVECRWAGANTKVNRSGGPPVPCVLVLLPVLETRLAWGLIDRDIRVDSSAGADGEAGWQGQGGWVGWCGMVMMVVITIACVQWQW